MSDMEFLGKGVLSLLPVIGLVLLNGFFVAAEFALVSVRRSRMEELAGAGDRRAKTVQRALGHLDTYIAATQLGITMASLGLGFIGEPAIAHLIEPIFDRFLPEKGALITSHGIAIGVAFAIATALHIVFGELAPKSIALQRPESTSLWVTSPLNLFLTLFRPFILLLNGMGNAVVRLIGLRPAPEHAAVHSVQELEILVQSTREAGLLQEEQEEMVSRVFHFEDTIARKVMTPRLDVTAVEADATLEELIGVIMQSGHSRLPVYDDDLDNIIGIIHAKDVLKEAVRNPAGFVIREHLRPPIFIPETKRMDDLLADMRRHHSQIVIVRDEFGTVTGVVTIEDLVEEVFGEIQDEYDREEPLLEEIDAQTLRVDARMPLAAFNEALGADIALEESDTIGGFVFGLFGHQPQQGEETRWKQFLFQVEETDGRRIQKLRVTRLTEPPAGDGLGSEADREE